MRKVHAFCYYCLEEYDDERMLAAKCGPTHVRNIIDIAAIRPKEFDEKLEERMLNPKIIKKYDKDVMSK